MTAYNEVHEDNLALFEKPSAETGIQSKEWITYRPINQLTEGSALEFSIQGTSTTYIDLKNTYLLVKAKVTKKDGTNLATTDNVTTINMPLHSMFSQVDVSLQQQPLSEVGPNYAYKAYFDVLLNTKSREELECMLFYDDTALHFDDTDAKTGSNGGLTNRYNFTQDSITFDLIGHLQVDICQQDRLLLNGVPLSVKLWPATDAFRLMATDKTEAYKINVFDAALKVCTVKVHPGVLLGHAEA